MCLTDVVAQLTEGYVGLISHQNFPKCIKTFKIQHMLHETVLISVQLYFKTSQGTLSLDSLPSYHGSTAGSCWFTQSFLSSAWKISCLCHWSDAKVSV